MALQMGSWEVDYRPQGWVRLKESGVGPTVYMQFEQVGEVGHQRFDLASVALRKGGDDALSARTWRRIPFSALEMHMALPGVGDTLTAECDVTAPSFDSLDDYFAATAHLDGIHGIIPSSDSLIGDGTAESPARRLPRIKSPQGRLTDDFLRDVAEAYRWYTEANQAPAPSISKMSGVPVRTVHRWIYEARKRSILPPARTGRAG
jgi:hypothetical protein